MVMVDIKILAKSNVQTYLKLFDEYHKHIYIRNVFGVNRMAIIVVNND